MDLEHKAIERIKMASEMSLHHYGKPLICTYSGGKDSDVMLELFIRSGIPFEVHNNHTTADAPETVRHIRKKFQRLEEHGIKCEIEMYLNAFARMLKELDRKGKSHTWETPEDVYRWWIEDETIPGQLEFDPNGTIKEATI